MLSEDRRTQLDGIVRKMIANKEDDKNIQFVVNDFTSKYNNETQLQQSPQTSPRQQKQPSLIDKIKGVGKTILSGPQSFLDATSSLAKAGGAALAGDKQGASNILNEQAAKIGKNPFFKGTAAGLESAALVAPISQATLPARIAAGAVTGYGFDVANKIKEDKTGGEIFLPGLGTVVGAGFPLATKLVGTLAKYATGATSGVGKNVIQQAIDNPRAVDEAIREYAKTPELKHALVDRAKAAIGEFLHVRGEDYETAVSKMVSKQPISKQVVIDEFAKQVDRFGGKVNGKQLGFGDTALTVADINNLKKAWSAISKWQDVTPQGLDKLRQAIGNYMKDFKMAGNPRANVVLGAVQDALSKKMKANIPGYAETLAKYGKKTHLAETIRDELSLGGRAKPSTQLNSVLRLFKKDPLIMEDIVKVMGEKEAKEFLNDLAGAILSEWLPTGRVGNVLRGLGEAGLGYGAATGAVSVPTAAGAAAIMSPRIVGKAATTTGRVLQSRLPVAAKKSATVLASNKNP